MLSISKATTPSSSRRLLLRIGSRNGDKLRKSSTCVWGMNGGNSGSAFHPLLSDDRARTTKTTRLGMCSSPFSSFSVQERKQYTDGRPACSFHSGSSISSSNKFRLFSTAPKASSNARPADAAGMEEYYYPEGYVNQDISPTSASTATNKNTTSMDTWVVDVVDDPPEQTYTTSRTTTTNPKDEQFNNEQDVFSGIKSRPIPNGSWNPHSPLEWSAKFGKRSTSQTLHLKSITKLSPSDPNYFDVSDMTVEGVTIVRTIEQAKIVMEKLMSADPAVYHACDTEVMEIDLKSVGPVGNGYVTCLSVYSGLDFDYGLGDGPGTALWVDNLDDAQGVLMEFKEWLEDERFLKVWHNYGFDRHVLFNEDIDVKGFGGDTMHLARLQNTGRSKMVAGNSNPDFIGGYSLEALTNDLLGRRKRPMKEIFGVKRLRKDGSEGSLVDIPPVEVMQRDPQFRKKWIMYSAYDAEGTWLVRQELERLLHEMEWMKGGHDLYEYYYLYLREFGEVLTDMERRGIQVDAKDYLAGVEVQARKDRVMHDRAFREWAAGIIGADGLAMNIASSVQLGTFLFGGAKNQKTGEESERIRTFKTPRGDISEEALNAYADQEAKSKQQQLNNNNHDAAAPAINDVEKDDFDHMTAAQLKDLCREYGLKLSGRKAELQERLRGHFLAAAASDGENASSSTQDDFESMTLPDLRDACIVRGLSDKGTAKVLKDRLREDSAFCLELLSASSPKDASGYQTISEALEAALQRNDVDGKTTKLSEILESVKEKAGKEKKYVDVTIKSLGMNPEKYTAGGAPSVTADVLRSLAGDPTSDPPKYGTAYEFFGKDQAGHDACVAFYSLTQVGSIDTMIANFLTSLQALADDQSRVHCSLNFNTETGRLSSRRPNLQNQPALEKDVYKIRKSFQSSPKNNLIVADYGQLELRLLASMTNCRSMIDAFQDGGDFHSRTAMGMFDYIQQKVDDGDILFEWDYSKGEKPPKPLVKDEFASERRKAKTLNFSIAYGKTAHGLSKDWGVTVDQANEMLEKWYNSRPEVLKWQKNVKKKARQLGITRTLMGRYRNLPHAKKGGDRRLLGHSERASINTPIQGGAADVAMMAMIKINNSELLKRLGWILLLQIHDEVILEGPEETAEEAFDEVIKCMENPWVFGLEKTSVPLLVDGSFIHKDWYDAK